MILQNPDSLQLTKALEILTYDVTKLLTRIMSTQKSSAMTLLFLFVVYFNYSARNQRYWNIETVSSQMMPSPNIRRNWFMNDNEMFCGRMSGRSHRVTDVHTHAHRHAQTCADYFWPGHSFMCLCGFSICIFSIMKCWLCGMFDLNDCDIHWYYWLRNVICEELIKIAKTNIMETSRTLPVLVSGEQNI